MTQADLIAPSETCPDCWGFGERYTHSKDCRHEHCALAMGPFDCDGRMEPCPAGCPMPGSGDAEDR